MCFLNNTKKFAIIQIYLRPLFKQNCLNSGFYVHKTYKKNDKRKISAKSSVENRLIKTKFFKANLNFLNSNFSIFNYSRCTWFFV